MRCEGASSPSGKGRSSAMSTVDYTNSKRTDEQLMMRQLRITTRILIETLIGIRQSGWSNWLVISILAIALTIFGGILQLTMTLKNVVTTWGSQLEISAFLKDGYDPKRVAQEVSVIPNVQLVEIIPKE